MRSSRHVFLLFPLAFMLALSTAEAALDVGDRAEPFSLEKRDGGEAAFPGDFAGKVLFINFWASWCPECRVELPELKKIADRYKGRPFELLAINFDKRPSTAEKFLKKIKTDLVVLFDSKSEVVRAFGPVGVPASYLVAPDGTVVGKYIGFKEEYIEKYIRDIEAELAKAGDAALEMPSIPPPADTDAGQAAEEGPSE